MVMKITMMMVNDDDDDDDSDDHGHDNKDLMMERD